MEGIVAVNKKIGFIINQTHMDIEWYLSLDGFAPWFVETIEILKKVTSSEPDYKSFVLDGCVFPLEEAIRRKPTLETDACRLVKEGKLAVGPFYTQYDELIPAGESIIMNCLWGKRSAEEFGKNSCAGYLPDNFGHPAQLPQIMRGFGIDSLIFMRGKTRECSEKEFIFVGPDGSKLYAVNTEYNNGFSIYQNKNNKEHISTPFMMPYLKPIMFDYTVLKDITRHIDKEGIAQQFIANVRAWAKDYPTGVIPLFCGSDHCPPNEGISDTIKLANELADDIEFRMGDITEYADLLRERMEKLPLYHYEGDLLGYVSDVRFFGVHTSRIYQKVKNFECEKQMFSYALPLDAFSVALGMETDKIVLDDAMKKLMLSITHDSIHGGCSDEAHIEIDYRYSSVAQNCATSSDAALKRISAKMGATVEGDGHFLVYTPVLRQQAPTYAYLNVGDGDVDIYDEKGNLIPSEIVPRTPALLNINGDPYYHSSFEECVKRVNFNVNAKTPGVATYTYKRKETQPVYAMKKEGNAIENEYIKIVAEGCNVILIDKQSGKRWENIAMLRDEADAGDEFDFSTPWIDGEIIDSTKSATKIRTHVNNGDMVSTLTVEFELYLPEYLCDDDGRSEEKIRMPFKLTYTLYNGIKRADVKLQFENRAKDHRMRLHLPRLKTNSRITTGGLFMSNEYNPDKNLGEVGNSGHNCRELPFHDYIAEHTEDGGLATAFRGLYTYEVYEESIAVTILRSVGILFKENLRERRTGCVGLVYVPDAQCIRPLTLEWCHIPFEVTDVDSAFTDTVESYLAPPQTYTMKDPVIAGGPTFFAPFEIDADQNIKLSAIRQSIDGEYMLLRVYESDGNEGTIRVKLDSMYQEAFTAGLDESKQDKLVVTDGCIEVKIAPHKIVTLLFK